MTSPAEIWSDNSEICRLASRFSENHIVDKHTIDIFKICTNNNWFLLPYEILETIMYTSADKLIDVHGKYGFAFYDVVKERYIIAYNSNMPYEEIIKTVAHEIGHIVCGHISPLNPHKCMADVKTLQDWEQICDIFAMCLLNQDKQYH